MLIIFTSQLVVGPCQFKIVILSAKYEPLPFSLVQLLKRFAPLSFCLLAKDGRHFLSSYY